MVVETYQGASARNSKTFGGGVIMSTPQKPATEAAPERAPIDPFEHKKCMERLETTLTTNKHAQKVMDSITALGCPLPADFFVCRPCESDMFGGFMTPNKNTKPKIIMCENKSVDKQMFQSTVIHELIHAYDVCRSKFDVKDCKHRACTEIRASSLRYLFIR